MLVQALSLIDSLSRSESLVYYLKVAVLLAAIPLAVYFLLFAPVEPLHTAFHGLRHSLLGVPCH